MARIVIVGGAGTFGKRIVARLARSKNIDITIAGRTEDRLKMAAHAFGAQLDTDIQTAVLDSSNTTANQLADVGADIVINASGPFQEHDRTLAQAAIANKCHYIDLADARDYVMGFERLDLAAQEANVLVLSGASTVPGLSSTVVGHLAQDLALADTVSIGISPGNHFEPGLATTQSVLNGLGQPILTRHAGKPATCYGWQNVKRGNFGTLGNRWLSNVDVPDLDLFPQHYPEVQTVSFQAGTELSIQHLGLWGLSWLARARLLRRPERLAKTLLALRRMTRRFGSDRGGMFVTVTGRDHDGAEIEKRWTLVARDGHGPFIPTLASVILAKSLAKGELPKIGASPCFNLVSYQDVLDEISDLSITCTIDQAMR